MQPLNRIAVPNWAANPAVSRLLRTLDAEGAVSRFVGGAVRDTLLLRSVRDVDIATTGLAEDNLKSLQSAGITVHPTGLRHGTITAVLDHQGFEITTLRQDLQTDGRHAVVQATDNWQFDAERRDFTMNAIYMDADGTIYDPVGGYDDLLTGRIRFIGNPEQRVAEDYLRILRFFRFFAWYGDGDDGGVMDLNGIAACKAAAGQIQYLARERIGQEMLKLLAAPVPRAALVEMLASGVLTATLNLAPDLAALDRLMTAEAGTEFSIDPSRRLAALCNGSSREKIENRINLSRHQAKRLDALLHPTLPLPDPNDHRALKTVVHYQGSEYLRDRFLLAGDVGAATLAAAITVDAFPLKGRDLRARGVAPGPAIGEMLASLETWWLESDAMPNRKECLIELARRLGEKREL